MGIFGKKKATVFDEAQDKQLQALVNNQNVLIKNNAWFIQQIEKMNKENQAQTAFDNQVAAKFKEYDTKLATYLQLAEDIKVLKQQLAALQQTSHTHQAVNET